MKLGYPLRKTLTKSLELIRGTMDILSWTLWAVFDFSKFKRIDPKKINQLLVIYGGAAGDVFSVTGLLNELSKKRPDLGIYFLTYEKNRKLVSNNSIQTPSLEEAKNLMKENHFDALIMLQGASLKKELFESKMHYQILKIPYRVTCDNMHISLFYKQLPFPFTRKIFALNSKGFHDHLKSFNALGFKLSSPKHHSILDSEEFLKNFSKKHKITKWQKVVVLNPGSGKRNTAIKRGLTPSSEWPIENWAKVADALIEGCNARIIFSGDPSEMKTLVKEICSKMKPENLRNVIQGGVLSFDEIASLFKKSCLLISIDTGTVHLAAQTTIPIISLFGPISISGGIPIREKDTICLYHTEVCSGCRLPYCPEKNNICLKAISPLEVLESAKEFIGRKTL